MACPSRNQQEKEKRGDDGEEREEASARAGPPRTGPATRQSVLHLQQVRSVRFTLATLQSPRVLGVCVQGTVRNNSRKSLSIYQCVERMTSRHISWLMRIIVLALISILNTHYVVLLCTKLNANLYCRSQRLLCSVHFHFSFKKYCRYDPFSPYLIRLLKVTY